MGSSQSVWCIRSIWLALWVLLFMLCLLILSFGFLTAHEYFAFSSRMLLSLFRFAQLQSCCLFLFLFICICFKVTLLSVSVNDQLLPKTILHIFARVCLCDFCILFAPVSHSWCRHPLNTVSGLQTLLFAHMPSALFMLKCFTAIPVVCVCACCVSSCSLLILESLKCFCVSLSLVSSVSVSVVVPAPARFMSCPVHNPCRVWKRSSPLSFWVRRASLGWLAPAVLLLLQQRPVKSQLSPRCLYHFCLSLHLACSGSRSSCNCLRLYILCHHMSAPL